MKMRLHEAKEHTSLRIVKLHLSADKNKRLMQMGFHEGANIVIECKSTRNKPGLYLVCGNRMMLRHEDAKKVEVETT